MARSSTTFSKGQVTNPKGRAPLTAEQREARDMRALFQPEGVRLLIELARNAGENKDRIAALKILIDEMPIEVLDLTERGESSRPIEELLAIGLGALMAKKGTK